MRLAAVVIEEHTRRAVHLADDDALGAVDDEGAVLGHERHVAHVDVLLLDVLDGAGAGLLVHIEHDETQLHLERSSVGHVALLALVDIVLRRLELVALEIERRPAGEIGDREHRFEDRLQPLFRPTAGRLPDHQEVVVRALLHLDEVGHLCDLGDRAELLTDALAAAVVLSHLEFLVLRSEGKWDLWAAGPEQLPQRRCHCLVGRALGWGSETGERVTGGASASRRPNRGYLISTTAP